MTSTKPEALPERRYAVFCSSNQDEGGEYCYEDEYNKAINSFKARERAIAQRLNTILIKAYEDRMITVRTLIAELIEELERK